MLSGLVATPTAAQEAPSDHRRGFFWANAWANHHTARPGGDGTFAMSGKRRMERMVRLIKRRDADVGVIVEMERVQVRAFLRAGGGRYAMVTGGTPGRGILDGVFYDTAAYRLVDSYRFRSWTKHGRRARVPVVFLDDRRTGQRIAVMAVHHAAFGSGAHWRERALRREIREVRRIRRAHGRAVTTFVGGDFNSTENAYCRMRKAGMRSPVPRARRCHDTPVGIDQLFGDRQARFSGYRRIVRRDITDHPAVYLARFRLAAPPVSAPGRSISEDAAAAPR